MKRVLVLLALVMCMDWSLIATEDEALQKALLQARTADRKRDHGGVVKHLTAALALKPGAVAAAGLHQARGEAHF